MSQARSATMTPEEFLVWEEQQEGLWEFDGVRPVAMNGGTWEHMLIRSNLHQALASRLKGGRCRAAGPELRVPTGSGRYRFPDVLVTCSPVVRGTKEIIDPVVIFEVLSPSTFETDRGDKMAEYQAIPSLRRYVLLDQTVALLTVITRLEQVWSLLVLRAGDSLALPEFGMEVPVDEIYAGVELSAREG